MESFLKIILALIPLVLGLLLRTPRVKFATLQSIGLMTLGALGGGLIFLYASFQPAPGSLLMASAVLLAGFCVIYGQEKSHQAQSLLTSVLIFLGLSLGGILNPGPEGKIFICGLLGTLAFSIQRESRNSFRTTAILLHMVAAIFLYLASLFSGNNLPLVASLFLALTFLPLAPFHLPFSATIEVAKGTLSGFLIVVWLAIGLSELNMIYTSLTADTLFALRILALITAIYASLKCLGQKQYSLFVVSATVAHATLIWGLLGVFPDFPKWGLPFGLTVGFVMGGLCLLFSFTRQRYGWQIIGKLPGLAAPMPRFGVAMGLLVSFAMILPLVPVFSGLLLMPTTAIQDVALTTVLSIFLVVWLGSAWYFSQMFHQTAFGTARSDVPYTDLRGAEIIAVSVLLLGATYSGLVY